jgi:hypothetical protein
MLEGAGQRESTGGIAGLHVRVRIGRQLFDR